MPKNPSHTTAIDSGLRHRTRPDEIDVLASSTARAVLFSALTTILTFCSPAFASHRGLASFGRPLTIGVSLTLVCYVVVLPAVLAWGGGHRGRGGWKAAAVALLAGLMTGCMVGPDYRPPTTPTAERWLPAGTPRLRADTGEAARWWQVFGDPALDDLVALAYRENPTLEAAGLRVVRAQAGRGVAIGGLWPQRQALSGSYTRSHLSLNTVTAVINRGFDSFQAGFDAAWEVDLWGRFRRGIEAADADLLAAVADYDDVLVSLVAEVAATYVRIRTIEARLAIARDNVRVQRDSLEIARVRFEAGGTSELDVQQATTLLTDTEATIPELEIQLQQALDALSVLLGLPPSDSTELLGVSTGIPAAPLAVAVGIPADLLRHRPDVRRAERQLAAQSARIGVATSDLLPSIQLAGSVGLSAEDAAKFFQGRSFEAIGGPRFDWPVLNYGRLINNVRVQDAAFEELAALYTNTVLRAQQEVEDSLVGYLRGADQVMFLERSVAAAGRAVELSIIQYREGAADYTRVLDTQQAKLQEDDRLLVTRGSVTLSVVALYKALGGGWEMRDGHDFIPEETKAAMRDRTWWGDMLDADEQEADVEAAAAGTESDERPGFLRWRAWWPKW